MIRALTWLHGWLIRFLPRPFRDEYGDEVRHLFAERVRTRSAARGWLSGVVEAALGCADTSRLAVRHRLPTNTVAGVWRAAVDAQTTLRRSPVWTTSVVVILGLGLGATIAMYAVVFGTVLRPLPYDAAGRLIRIGSEREGRPELGSVSAPNFRDLEDPVRSLRAVAATSPASMNLPTPEGPGQLVRGGYVSGGFFDLLGVPAARGRLLSRADDDAAAPPAVVLSHSLWLSRFSGRSDAIGATLTIDGRPFTVVGIMGPSFQPPEGAHLGRTLLWAPLAMSSFPLEERSLSFLDVLGRMNDDVSIEAARSEIARIGTALAEANQLRARSFVSFQASPLLDVTIGGVTSRLTLLMAAVGLLLLITCANVTHLMLARTVARRRELTVRAALGAGRGQIRALVLFQAGWLSIGAGCLGWLVAHAAIAAVVRWAPLELPRLAELALDGPVLLFAVLAVAVSACAVGLAPAWQGSAGTGALRGGDRTVTGGGVSARFRDAVIVGQAAIGLVLLIGAGLLANSLVRLEQVDPGFETRDAWILSVRLAGAGDAVNAQLDPSVHEALLERVRAVAGVTSATLTTGAPFASGGWTTYIEPQGGRELGPEERSEMRVGLHQVSAGHLSALGAPVSRGRDIGPADTALAEPVAVVSRSVAETFWPGVNPLGHSLVVGGDGSFTARRVVGIVESPLYSSRREAGGLHVYLPFAQFPPPDVDVIIRAADVANLPESLRKATFDAASAASVLRLRRMDELLASELVEPRFLAGLLSAFSAVAVLLSCCGVFGALAYAVEQRRREIGVRLALGARAAQVIRQVAGRGVALVVIGAALGVVAARALAGGLEHFVFGITTNDPATYVAMTAVVIVAGTAAAWIPALRAGRVDPVRAMRAD